MDERWEAQLQLNEKLLDFNAGVITFMWSTIIIQILLGILILVRN